MIMNIPPKVVLRGKAPAATDRSHLFYASTIQCTFTRAQSFNSLRMARQGAPSDPASFTGGQINS